MQKNLKFIVTALAITVIAIFSGAVIEWRFDKDWTTLSRDGDVIANSKWVAYAERTYINKNMWYRENMMCPKIIEAGGHETATRCYYAPDTYELMSRSLLNTKITEENNVVTKAVPFYAYGTRGAYAGYVTETMVFSETEDIKEFPKSYVIDWKPKDTRNYKLVWRLEKLDTSDFKESQCSYVFGHVKIDLKDECDKLDYVSIEKGKATFYFKPMRAEQILDIDFVDPELVVETEQVLQESSLSVSAPTSWTISINDTENFYDLEDVEYDGKTFKLKMKAASEIQNITTDATKIDKIKIEKTDDKVIKIEEVKDLKELKTKLTIPSKDLKRDKALQTITFFDDYNRTTGLASYNYTLEADYTQEELVETCDEKGTCKSELQTVSYTRTEVTLKLGNASIYVVATIETDLKIVQTGLDNETSYVASIDASEGKAFFGQTDSTYDLTSDLELWISNDNNNTWDYSGNNNHGTATPATLNQDKWVTGQVGNGLDFDGSNDLIDVGTSINLTDIYSISLWFNLTDDNDYRTLFQMNDNNAKVIIWNNGELRYYHNNSFVAGYNADTNDAELMSHFVFVFNSTNALTYRNGTLIQTSGTLLPALEATGILVIGANHQKDNYYFNGIIDNVMIYNRTLNASEIADDYAQGLAGSETNVSSDGLVLWSKLDESGSSDYAADSSGEGNTGTLYGYPPEIVSGNLSLGMDFDGVEDWISTNLDINTSLPFTLSAWVYSADGIVDPQMIIETKGSNVIRFQETTASRYALAAWNTTGGSTTVHATGALSTTWQHLVGVYNTTHLSICLDSSCTSTPINGNIKDDSNTIAVGQQALNAGRFYNGTIDDVRIYSRALSADEIEALYNVTVSNYNTTALTLHSAAVTYDIVSNENTSVVVEVPEVEYKLSFTPTYVSINYSTITFNTTDSLYFGQETVTVSENYLNEPNLTRIRINNTYAMGLYDLMNFNLSSYLSFSPNDIISIWYDSYTGNSDNSTLKDTSDYTQWVDTCESGNTTGQVLCLNFNEGQGTSAHDRANNSHNNNDGTLTNMNEGIDNGTSGWTTSGKYGGATMYDGDDDNVECGNDASLNLTNTFTLSLWMYPIESDSGVFIANENDGTVSNEGGYMLYSYSTNNRFTFYTENESAHGDCTAAYGSISLNIWQHFLLTFDNGDTKMYKDGVSLHNCTNMVIPFSVYGTEIGNRVDNWARFNGTIDEVKIWNRALSAAEISDEYTLNKDYFDNLLNEEGSMSAGEDLDLFVTNGTVDSVAPTVSSYYQWNSTNETVDFGVWTDGFVSINWNLTDATGINTSTCAIMVRNKDVATNDTNLSIINDSIHPDYDPVTGYKNLTCYTEDLGGGITKVTANMTRSYDWRPLITGFDQDNAAHDNVFNSFGNRATKIVFHNITNTINTTFIFLADVVNQSATVADLLFYSCNSTYTTGDFTTDGNCALVGAAEPNSTRDVNFNYLIGALTTDENGEFGGVRHTEIMYGISYCPSCTNPGNAWQTYSTNGYEGHSATSVNLGAGWTDLSGEEFNVILHVIDNTQLEFNLTIEDNFGNELSDLQTDLYGPLANLAPFGDIQTDNVTGGLVSYYDIHNVTETGTIWINVTISDPNADTINCTIYLLNNDSSVNQTLLENYSIEGYGICPYEWDTTTVADGAYRLNVTAFDGSLTGYDESAGYILVNNVDAGAIWIYPQSNLTSSLWMIDFGLTGGNVSNYSDSCGTIPAPNTESVSTNKNGSYALSIMGEMGPLGYSEKLKFTMSKFPVRFYENSYRIFFQMNSNLTENTVTQIDLNISEIAERTGLTTSDIDTDTYRLYRISYYGGIHNESGICYELPIEVGD